MNDSFGELKARYRNLSTLISKEAGTRILDHLDFARAMSDVHRLLRKADRTRAPNAQLRASMERAEALGKSVR